MANVEEMFVEIGRILRDDSQLEKVLWFLSDTTDQEQKYIKLLESVYVSNKEAFQGLVEMLSVDVHELNRNPNYKKIMDEMWHSWKPDGTNFVRGQRLDFQVSLEKQKRFEIFAICLSISILLRLDVLTPESLQKLIPLFKDALPLTNLFNIKELLSMSQKLSGDRYEVTANVFYIVYDIYQIRKRRENGEISGIRCFKNIVDGFTELVSGVAGGFGGELFGSTITPGMGTWVGGVGGGVASTFVCGALFDRLTQRICNLPKDELLENAYQDLGLPCNASNNELNITFVRLAHQFPVPIDPQNPDWRRLKQSINTIKSATA